VANGSDRQGIWKVIFASSAGTLIEWYDFYIFGSLATTLAPQFFPKENPTAALLSTLATFAVGFIIRPFGAVFFGRLGDLVGRKTTFLLTLILMGGSTFAIGLLPTYGQVGVLAPILLLLLRMLQGLALGGEYGGAATYVAEHSPDGKRGFYTSFIQTTATLGLFVSLGVILLTRGGLAPGEFDSWGWRIPFLLSVVLVIFSYVIRTRMKESPMFARLKSSGEISKNPLRESFVNPQNRRLVLLALFGATAGQGVVWYTGQFYALYFLQTVLNVAKDTASIIVAIALLLATPFFIAFGALSDRIGRKPIIVAGMVLAAACYVPIYMGMASLANIDTSRPLGSDDSLTTERKTDPKTGDQLVVTTKFTNYLDGTVKETVTDRTPADAAAKKPEPEKKLEVNPGPGKMGGLVFLIFIQVLFVTMVYGPIAAFLVELFPTRIRYTSLSVPYHIGNGIFGGLVPLISTALEKGSGNIYMGLSYPIGVALVSALIGGLFIRERRDVKLWEQEA
jgi:MFS family permease